jgi:hypothetical protein
VGVTLEQTKKVAAATEAEISKNGWKMPIGVVSNEVSLLYFGHPVRHQRRRVAMRKAKAAAEVPRPMATSVIRQARDMNRIDAQDTVEPRHVPNRTSREGLRQQSRMLSQAREKLQVTRVPADGPHLLPPVWQKLHRAILQ